MFSSMMFVSFVRGLGVAAFQKSLDFFFFLQICGSLWIHFFHAREFVIAERGQTPDEVHELPAVCTLRFCPAECRHSRKPNAILDDVIQFAVAQLLRCGQSHVRWFRIEALADRRVTASIVSMAERAMIGEMLHRFREDFRACCDRTCGLASRTRYSQTPEAACHVCLHCARLVASAEAA